MVNVDVNNAVPNGWFAVNVSQVSTRQHMVTVDRLEMTVIPGRSFGMNLTQSETPISRAPAFTVADGETALQYIELTHTIPNSEFDESAGSGGDESSGASGAGGDDADGSSGGDAGAAAAGDSAGSSGGAASGSGEAATGGSSDTSAGAASGAESAALAPENEFQFGGNLYVIGGIVGFAGLLAGLLGLARRRERAVTLTVSAENPALHLEPGQQDGEGVTVERIRQTDPAVPVSTANGGVEAVDVFVRDPDTANVELLSGSGSLSAEPVRLLPKERRAVSVAFEADLRDGEDFEATLVTED